MGSAIRSEAPLPIFFSDSDSKDRFGIPKRAPSLLERRQRAEAIKNVARELFQTVVRHFGARTARHLFREIAKAPPSGKQPDEKKHRELLRIYDRELARGEHPKKSLPRIIASDLGPEFGNSPEAREKTIRRVLKERQRHEEELDERLRDFEKVFGRAPESLPFGRGPESLLSKAKATRTQQP
jgi:hypothetical protein